MPLRFDHRGALDVGVLLDLSSTGCRVRLCSLRRTQPWLGGQARLSVGRKLLETQVDIVHIEPLDNVVGLRFAAAASGRHEAQDTQGVATGASPLPGLVAAVPIPGGHAPVRIQRMGRSFCTIEATQPGLVLAPGLRVQLRLWAAGDQALSAEVLWCDSTADGLARAGLRLLNVSAAASRCIAELLTATTSHTPAKLRACGLGTQRIAHVYRRVKVSSKRDFLRVLEFWESAYRSSSTRYADHLQMLLRAARRCGPLGHSLRQDKALLYAYYHQDRLVATVSLAPAQGLPESFSSSEPGNIRVLEMGRLAIDSDYRQSDLMRRVCQDTYREIVYSRSTHVAIWAPPWLVKRYAFYGFRPTDALKPAPEDPALLLRFMVMKKMRWGTYGLHLDPVRWNIALREVSDGLEAEGALRYNPIQRLAFGVYRALGPAANFFESHFIR